MKTFPIQGFKTDAYNACMFVCKAALAATAIAAAGVALHRFLQQPEPTCSDILKDIDAEPYISHHAHNCFELQQKAIGLGTPEECMAALSDYHPVGTSTLDIVAAMGGAETFCNLPSVELQEEIVPQEPIPKALVKTILEEGSVRGIDSSSYHLFAGVRTSVTKTYTHPLFTQEEIEKNGLNSYDTPHANIYYHAYGNTKNAWEATSCKRGQWRCSGKGLTDSDVQDLGRLVKGETVCDSDISAGFSTKTCRVLA